MYIYIYIYTYIHIYIYSVKAGRRAAGGAAAVKAPKDEIVVYDPARVRVRYVVELREVCSIFRECEE